MGLVPDDLDLARLTTRELEAVLDGDEPVVAIVPVGSVEPHGPHLPLSTDIIISRAAAARGAELLRNNKVMAFVAPDVPYGVTECASAFKGAISVSADALTTFLLSVADGFLSNGFAHVCFVNNHLEPAHDTAVRAAKGDRVSVACPLTRRWGRTLSDEFKSGACHAGNYETSIMMAATPDLVREEERKRLTDVPVSLSEKLQAGINDFVEMGLTDAYAGAPADATALHGNDMIDRLAEMVHGEVMESLGFSDHSD